MKKICAYIFWGSCTMYAPFKIEAQVADTLAAIKLLSKKPLDITTSTLPVQRLDEMMLSKLNSVSVADAVKYFPGVVVKDYGGIGGLKTVSVRSLGANHTGVMYDGIMVGDAQGGQIDLGRFSLDNLESIQLFNSQPTEILLPARSYASASVIALSSSAANDDQAPATAFAVKMKSGSFSFLNPSVYFKKRINKKFSTGVNAEYQSAKGNYPFRDYETGHIKKERMNADLKMFRIEYDARYAFNDSNALQLKAYYYQSKRGLPGAVILFNDFSSERLNNQSFFSQASWQKNISAKSRLLIRAKFSTDYKYYIDPSYQNNAGKLENEFYQKEYYVSAAYSYMILPELSASYAADYFRNTLKRTDPFAVAFANPQRDNLLNNVAVQWKYRWLTLNGNMLHTYITGKVEQGPLAKNIAKFTPAFSVSVQPFVHSTFRLRAFYKNIFRVPGFDDLYYTNIGNAALLPEYATLYNLGATFSNHDNGFIQQTVFTIDAYYNEVRDKILAVPRQNLFQWTILNIAKAATKGMDAAAHLDFKKWHGVQLSTSFSYSYQQALDISNRSSALYKTQLPYTPIHSGSVNINVGFKSFSVSYNILSSSYRYRLGEPGPENVVQGFATHDISLSYLLTTKKYWQYKFVGEINNIYNLQYEIIKYYPMPRFNYRLGIIASLKK